MVVKNIANDRKKAEKLVVSKNFISLILFLILFDSVILGLMTSSEIQLSMGFELFFIDRLIVAIFICEMLLKLYAYGPKFFKSGWNIMDLTVVAMSIIPATSYFVILRSFRILRLLRYVDKDLKISQFLQTILKVIPIFMSFVLVYVVFLYVFSVLSVGMFGNVFIEFSSLSDALSTLLQIVSFQSYALGLVESVMIKFDSAWMFFVGLNLISFMLVVSMISASVREVVAENN